MDGDVLRVLSKWAICLIKSLYTESAEPKGHFIWMNRTPIQNPIQTLRWTMSKWFSNTKASNKLKFNFLRPGWPQMNLVILFRFLELVKQLLQYSRFYASSTSECFGSSVPMIVYPEKAHSARFYIMLHIISTNAWNHAGWLLVPHGNIISVDYASGTDIILTYAYVFVYIAHDIFQIFLHPWISFVFKKGLNITCNCKSRKW